MQHQDHVFLIRHGIDGSGETWADLGSAVALLRSLSLIYLVRLHTSKIAFPPPPLKRGRKCVPCLGKAKWGDWDHATIRTNLRTQGPVRRAMLKKLGGIGMFPALVHLAARTHATLDHLESAKKRAMPCESF